MFMHTLAPAIKQKLMVLSAALFSHNVAHSEHDDPMGYWQDRMFIVLSLCFIVLGLPLWVYSASLFHAQGDDAVGILTGLLYLFMAFALFRKAWDKHLRKLLFIAALYTLSVVILIFTGLKGAGMVCIAFTLVLASCLLERTWLLYVIAANFGVFSLLSALLMLNVLESFPMHSYHPVWWIHVLTTQVLSVFLVITIRIITDSLESQLHQWRLLVTEVEYLSFHDGLTGLYNRRFFDKELKRLDTSMNLPLTMMMLDVNGLKLTNDAFGHRAGDKLLTRVANVLQDTCRAKDIVARIGGDEFAILLPQWNDEQAHQLSNRIQKAISYEQVEGLPVSISCGWGTKTDQQGSMIDDIFKTAEDHMCQHKISERGSYRHQTIDLIMQTLYAKSAREQQHSKRVSLLCTDIGLVMGLEANALTTAGMLHDIGKVAISETILDKVLPLADSEWTEMKRHSEAGYNILSSVNDYGPLAACVLSHHERWDGTGYPNGLKGEAIPLLARIIAIADSYDAMVSNRPYRKGMSHEDALEEIKVCAGKQFDPEIVRVFIEMTQVSLFRNN